MTPLNSLIAAALALVGTHFALSHPLRAPLVRLLGTSGFQILYSLVAAGSLGWIVMAFRAVGPGEAALWNGQSDALWVLASLLTLLAWVLLVGSFAGNPALPVPNAAELAAKPVHGVFNVTRHPMMWAFALWAFSHVLISPTARSLVLAGAIGVLALVGSHFQDRKKAELMGDAWSGWAARTSYWPRPSALFLIGAMPWIGGTALWFAATLAHRWLNGMDAGLWRWLA